MLGLRIALAQINPTVGDLQGNTEKILQFVARAKRLKADLVIFPELAVGGYPPDDLLLKPKFISDNIKAVSRIAKKATDIAVILGFVDRRKGRLFNSAGFLADGKIKHVVNKKLLPNYGVFDEKRYFEPGEAAPVFLHKAVRIGVNICEDIWHSGGPCTEQIRGGKADLIININASPYQAGKTLEREKVLRARLKGGNAYIAYVNMVGGQDELIFDGGSLVLSPKGAIEAMGPQFEEELIVFDVPSKKTHAELKPPIKTVHAPHLKYEEEIYGALKLALKDYVSKNGFKKVLIGLSGGIDSGLVAAIASDALGGDNVNCVFMPSEFTSARSREDAEKISGRLKVDLAEIPIKTIMGSYVFELSEEFKGRTSDITEENLQARIRGNLLMALSNKFGWLVLTTGNKSEMSVGYATLYGDMAGGFALIKDIPKTLVYRLAAWRNSVSPVIPQSMIEREPTAELKEGQKDQDTLPPYDVLDRIIELYIERNLSLAQIVRKGYPRDVVERSVRMIDRSEYKRRQSPPGPKVTHRAFGKDWRLPITNGYKG